MNWRHKAQAALWAVALGFIGVGASACGHQPVKAHQREWLADRIMSLDGNPQERAADQHILSNREGAIGGTGTAGGGCGCN
jgi:hypothetical protein